MNIPRLYELKSCEDSFSVIPKNLVRIFEPYGQSGLFFISLMLASDDSSAIGLSQEV
jgi:hypothetical protein